MADHPFRPRVLGRLPGAAEGARAVGRPPPPPRPGSVPGGGSSPGRGADDRSLPAPPRQPPAGAALTSRMPPAALAVPPARRSPLHATHQALHAKFSTFGGWEMPLYYSSILKEHQAVRTCCGVFDVTHLAQVEG